MVCLLLLGCMRNEGINHMSWRTLLRYNHSHCHSKDTCHCHLKYLQLSVSNSFSPNFCYYLLIFLIVLFPFLFQVWTLFQARLLGLLGWVPDPPIWHSNNARCVGISRQVNDVSTPSTKYVQRTEAVYPDDWKHQVQSFSSRRGISFVNPCCWSFNAHWVCVRAVYTGRLEVLCTVVLVQVW